MVFLVFLLQPMLLQVHASENNSTYDVIESKETNEIFYIQKSDRFKCIKKPSVAVALGGGGARALVNVGILKALEEEDIPVDLVVGSSMGAIVAVLYGSGMPIEEIEQLVTTDILPSMFDLNFPFTRSVIDTKRVNFFMEKVSPHKRLEDFPILTALLSYDLTNGVKYVHTSGDISREIQGSYAIPIFFPIDSYNGLFLMDPGILELTPAQTAKILGADMVISTTAFDELPYSTYGFPIRAWTRFINLIKEKNSQEIINRFSEITINCDVGDYSFMDYHLAADFIAMGYNEAKKLIPNINKILKDRNIPLKSEQKSIKSSNYLNPDLPKVISDIKYQRLKYNFTRIKPIVYFGREQSFFKQDLFKDELFSLQYGMILQKGSADLKLLTRGKHFDYLETQLKVIGLTPSIDLIGKLHLEQQKEPSLDLSYGLNLTYYNPDFTFSLGWVNIKKINYLYNGGTFERSWGKLNIKGEGSLYTPYPGQDVSNSKYVYSQAVNIGLGKSFALKPKLVWSNTENNVLFSHPIIYRGFDQELATTQMLVQSSIELDYKYRFPYSLEFFQCIQLKEVSWYQFIDTHYNIKPLYALGSGVTCDLNLLGIKPFSFGGYVAYDLEKGSWRSSLALDLSF
jgi:NTE family protein